MKQSEIIKKISKRTLIRPDAVLKVLRALTPIMCEVLENDKEFTLGIGVFAPIVRAPKAAYNFKTGEKMTIPPTTRIEYRPSFRIKQILRQKDIERSQLYFNFESDVNNAKN